MTRTVLLLGTALAGLLLGPATACGQTPAPISAASARPTVLETSPAGGATAAPAASSGGGSTSGRTPTPAGSQTHSPAPAATASAGLPEILSFSGAPSRCAAASGSVSVTLTWTSKNATEAWMTHPPVAVAAGDPKTTQGATGPLPANGSTTMSFDCGSQYNYYDLGVYGGGHSSGEILQVARSM